MRDTLSSLRKGPLIATVSITIVMLILIHLRIRGVEGPWYGTTYYRLLPALRAYPLLLLTALPTIAAIVLFSRVRRGQIALLLLPMLGAFSGKIVSAVVIDKDMTLEFIPYVVMHPNVMSYYIDAAVLSNFPGWLSEHHEHMKDLNLHSKTKAPGPILYFLAFIKLMGHSRHTAVVAGMVLGALATLSIPMCYAFLRALELNALSAFCGACFLALCPGFVLYFPQCDPVYPILSCGIGICWIYALKRDSVRWSLALGLAMAAMLTISFNVLVFGVFLVAYALSCTGRRFGEALRISAKHAAIAAAVCALLMLCLFLFTGYDVVRVFQAAWINQHALLAAHASERPYPTTIWNDLLDFAMGSGWISFVLVAFAIYHAVQAGTADVTTRITLLCVGQLLFVAFSALLASETARVWNFMLPLLMYPIAIEMARQTLAGRIVILSCLATIMAAICRNMSLIL